MVSYTLLPKLNQRIENCFVCNGSKSGTLARKNWKRNTLPKARKRTPGKRHAVNYSAKRRTEKSRESRASINARSKRNLFASDANSVARCSSGWIQRDSGRIKKLSTIPLSFTHALCVPFIFPVAIAGKLC